LAYYATRGGDFDEVVRLYDTAAEQTREEDKQVDFLYQKALFLLRHGRMDATRQAAEAVLEVDENHGPSLILIGDYWAGLAGGGSIGAASPVWVAVDYYNRAASRDPEVASQARQKALSYSRYFPCRQDIICFGGPYREGEAYTTPQGARTTVKFRDC
jgi:hypothetical protein